MTVLGRVPSEQQVQLAPDDAWWSLEDAVPCGQACFQRPCQKAGLAHAVNHPLADVCSTDREIVFVVDDDEDLAAELVEMTKLLGFDAIGCSVATKLQELISAYKTGCIILDVKLPGQDGVAVQEWLQQAEVTLPIIFITGGGDVGTAVHCVKAGAFDFIQKPVSELSLRRAIYSAIGLSRKRYCMSESRRLVRGLLGTLTPTELFVARKIAKGHVTKRIAALMQRSENTVKIHRHRIFSKLRVNSAASIANLIRHAELPDN